MEAKSERLPVGGRSFLHIAIPIKRYRFTVADYHKMAEAGILGEDDRVELIEGEILEMSPIGRRHLATVDRLTHLFVQGLGDRAIVRVQGSVILRKFSEPQPDLLLLRPRPDFYATVDAGPEDVLLVVEVADTSVRYDQEIKIPLYARTGIPEAWLVNLKDRCIRVHRDPGPEGHRTVFTAEGDDRLSPQAFSDLVLAVGQILHPGEA